jgi:hypothetical protein
LNTLTPALNVAPSVDLVGQWIAQHAKLRERDPAQLRVCHGKRLLKEAFAHFTEATHSYTEVTDLPALAKLQLKIDKGPLVELARALMEVGACSRTAFDAFAAD